MIRFVTEDRSNSPFVKLFNAAYPDDVLYCAGTNTELEDLARRLASNDNKVVVYMDMVQDNGEIIRLYEGLLNLYSEEHLDVVVFPVVCAEYAFIKSVVGVGKTIYSTTGLDVILNKSLEYVSLISDTENVSQNFERFCKAFCKRCLNKACCAVTSNAAGLKQPYFADSCAKCINCGISLTLEEKSKLLHAQYPVVPCLNSSSSKALDWSAVVRLSYRYVDEYNSWCEAVNLTESIVNNRDEWSRINSL